MTAIKLSPRLQAVANLVPKGSRMADIGSDHAYLPAALLQAGQIDFAVVGEVAEGPLQNAEHTVKSQGLTDQVVCRLADGLAAIEASDAVDTVVIAGMGGLLIEKILTAGVPAAKFSRLILQPNTDQAAVRAWLVGHHYKISHEEIVQEGRHRYEMLVAEPGEEQLTAVQITFGPHLLKDQDPVFLTKWQLEYERINGVLDRLAAAGQEASDKYQKLQAQAKQIQEEVFHGKSTSNH